MFNKRTHAFKKEIAIFLLDFFEKDVYILSDYIRLHLHTHINNDTEKFGVYVY